MGLLDGFRRGPELGPEDWKRIGRLEAEVESLRLQWAGYRDELNRLVQRLEKRDQRALKALEGEETAPGSSAADDHRGVRGTGTPPTDRISAAILARRGRRVLPPKEG